jgi:acyl carrier protein
MGNTQQRDDTRQRLIRCFQAVFPKLSESDALRASANRVTEWDSVATMNLVAVVEEEFGVLFDVKEVEKLNSFERYLNRLSPGV